MAVCWPSARTCSLLPRFCTGRALVYPEPRRARLFVLARHRFSFSRHSPLLFTFDGRPSGRRRDPHLDKHMCACKYIVVPNKTIYVREVDLPLWELAQAELGES